MIPVTHRRGVFAFEHSATGENAQQTVSHLGLNLGDGFGTDASGFMKAHAACAIGLENAVDHNAVEMDVGIEQGAKAMDEGHSADPGTRTRPRATPMQTLLHRTEEEVQRQRLHGGIGLPQAGRGSQFLPVLGALNTKSCIDPRLTARRESRKCGWNSFPSFLMRPDAVLTAPAALPRL